MYSSGHREHGASGDDVLLLLFRLAIVTLIVIFQLLPEATVGWAAIWQEKSWPLAEVVSGLGIPQAPWVLSSAVILVFLAALGVACGFITRLSAVVLLIGAVLVGYRAVTETEVVSLELALVYGSVFIFLLLRGPGYLSADRFFRKSEM
ncbi:MAG: putative membrane protein YphA (DoxX/SURF4 family) [Verrucomicrobiales bacterium]|jgi:uncharacterized membrane protein YphA (DoxX/SURF4 family)